MWRTGSTTTKLPDYRKTPLKRLQAALASPGFDAAHKDAMRAELARRLAQVKRPG